MWSLLKPAPCSKSTFREKHGKEDKCRNMFPLMCIIPQQSVIWRLSEQGEVVPAFVLNSSWWTYRSWISLILSGIHLYFCSLQHDSRQFNARLLPAHYLLFPAPSIFHACPRSHSLSGRIKCPSWITAWWSGHFTGTFLDTFSSEMEKAHFLMAVRGLKPQTSHFLHACFNPGLVHGQRELLLPSA